MCLQQKLSEVRNEIHKLHFKTNNWSGRNYNHSKFKTDGKTIDRMFELQEQERDLLNRISNNLKYGNTKAVYGF